MTARAERLADDFDDVGRIDVVVTECVAPCRQDDDGRGCGRRIAGQHATQFESGHVRHLHIRNHKIRCKRTGQMQSLFAIACGMDLKAGIPQFQRKDLQYVLFIIDYENRCTMAALSRRHAWPPFPSGQKTRT